MNDFRPHDDDAPGAQDFDCAWGRLAKAPRPRHGSSAPTQSSPSTPALMLSPEYETALQATLQAGEDGAYTLHAGLGRILVVNCHAAASRHDVWCIVVPPLISGPVAEYLTVALPAMTVLSYDSFAAGDEISNVETLRLAEPRPANPSSSPLPESESGDLGEAADWHWG